MSDTATVSTSPTRIARAATAPAPADMTCSTQGDGTLSCTVSDEQLARVRDRFAPGARLYLFNRRLKKQDPTPDEKTRRANAPLWKCIWDAYRHFPVVKEAIYAGVAARMLTRDNLKTIVERPSGATAENHNKLRRTASSSSMSPEKAQGRGLVAMRLPLVKRCPDDFADSLENYYTDAKSCQDVVDEIDGHGLPVVMYVNRMPALSLQTYLGDLSVAPLYTRYVNDGPIPCQPEDGPNGGGGLTYHHIHLAPAIDVEYVMRSIQGPGYNAWAVAPSCTTVDGILRTPHDIMFNFGPHAFLSIDVDVDGRRETRTMTISMVAAASTSAFRGLVQFFAPDLAYERFIGGSFAKKILAEAEENGWTIER